MSTAKPTGFAEQLDQLAVERQALQQLLSAANSLDALYKGLESSLQLGKSAADLPPEAQKLYRALGSKIQNLSDDEVMKRLQVLERKVQAHIENIAPLIDRFVSPEPLGENEPAALVVSKQLDTFQRQAKTAITLRALLHKRGKAVPALKIPMPESVVQDKLKAIEHQEARYRVQVGTAIDAMTDDIDLLLHHNACSDAIRAELEQARGDLLSARKHLNDGLSIQTLPIAIDVIDMEQIEAAAEPEPQSVKPPTAVEPAVPEPAAPEPTVPEPTIPEPTTATVAPEAPAPGPPATPPSRTWWQKLIVWFNTPWGTRWRDIDDQ